MQLTPKDFRFNARLLRAIPMILPEVGQYSVDRLVNPVPISTSNPKDAHEGSFLFRPQRLHGIDGGCSPGRNKRRHKPAHHQQH